MPIVPPTEDHDLYLFQRDMFLREGTDVLIQTVTHAIIGTIRRVVRRGDKQPAYVTLGPAAWISETGEFGALLHKGPQPQTSIEAYPGIVTIPWGPQIVVTPWSHGIPRGHGNGRDAYPPQSHAPPISEEDMQKDTEIILEEGSAVIIQTVTHGIVGRIIEVESRELNEQPTVIHLGPATWLSETGRFLDFFRNGIQRSSRAAAYPGIASVPFGPTVVISPWYAPFPEGIGTGPDTMKKLPKIKYPPMP